jgi:hypothetical protein
LGIDPVGDDVGGKIGYLSHARRARPWPRGPDEQAFHCSRQLEMAAAATTKYNFGFKKAASDN